MRVLLISDLHANLPATEAVLAHAAGEGWDTALVLGDLVGYGADPADVIDRVRALGHATVIRGNHDKVVSGVESAVDFNLVARHAAEWTAAQLDEERLAYLRELPQGPLRVPEPGPGVTVCHGAPFDEDYYVFDTGDAAQALDASSDALVLYGHTHVQIAFRELRAGHRRTVTVIDEERIALGADTRLLLNPGSVGQPRDGDARAAYGILDSDEGVVRLYRVDYDVREAQARIRAAGLHSALADRLALGR